MSYRRLISVAVLATGAAVLPALPGQATPSTGSCNGNYPTNGPVLSLDVSPRTITAGQTSVAFGKLRKNACPIGGATIRIERKRLVNGTATGSWGLLKTTVTRSNGLYSTSIGPRHNVLVRAHFTGGGGFAAATSRSITVNVRTKITEAATKGSACKITLTGATRPTKVHHTVTIQKRARKGHFNGWHFFARGTT